MPYYGHIYYGYGDFLANNLYVLLLIPVLLSMASIPVFFIICMLQ